MPTVLSRFLAFTNKYQIIRGMLSYSVLWPVGSLLQQTIIEKRTLKTYDWNKCLRFCIYGAFVMGPTMFLWMRFAGMIWPKRSFQHSVSKAITEQFTYDPTAICAFLFLMTMMEGKCAETARHEVSEKFFDTYKVGAIYWPIVQTFNFSVVPLRNQVVCTSFFSMLWSSFLAYMKHLEVKAKKSKSSSTNQEKSAVISPISMAM